MQQQQREYADSISSDLDKREMQSTASPAKQRTILALYSCGLWLIVYWFVQWHNAGTPGTFSFAPYPMITNAEHLLLPLGLIIFTALLFFINLIFIPIEPPRPAEPAARAQYYEKIHVRANLWIRFIQYLRRRNPLRVALVSLTVWIAVFMCVAWQISFHGLSIIHFELNGLDVSHAPVQIIDTLFLVFFLITALVAALVALSNYWLYKQRKKLWQD